MPSKILSSSAVGTGGCPSNMTVHLPSRSASLSFLDFSCSLRSARAALESTAVLVEEESIFGSIFK